MLDLEKEIVEPKKQNTILNVFCILGYIGNGFWVSIMLFILLLSKEALAKMVPQLDNLTEKGLQIVYLIFVVMLVINVASLIGLILVLKRKKSGALLYSISNGFWVILMLYTLQPQNILIGLISVVFTVVILVNYKK